ncbi:hypothetical protein LOK49_Contig111G00009 [Camellia lanceoleosa]|nr:hypothetical protein LOK49_Contig111G00009 [Camellia lanceoleosa]
MAKSETKDNDSNDTISQKHLKIAPFSSSRVSNTLKTSAPLCKARGKPTIVAAKQYNGIQMLWKTLPDYMKLCFLTLYNTVNEMTYDTLKQHGVNIIPYLTRAWADLCKAFLVEAKWCFNKETPTFAAYLENAWRLVSRVVILVHAYFLMTKTITKEALDSLQAYHSLLECSSIIFRLTNDLGTSKAELERGESANSILCYMKENGVFEQVAQKHISNLIDETWKKMNKDRIIDSPFEKSFVETTINLARISQCMYQHGDGHGSPDSQAKNRVLSVIIEPITLMEK